jgi:hypothetical protein
MHAYVSKISTRFLICIFLLLLAGCLLMYLS